MIKLSFLFHAILIKNKTEELVMKKIKSFIQKHANVMASLAMVFSVMAVNSRCVCIYHQPKMPKEMKKLKND